MTCFTTPSFNALAQHEMPSPPSKIIRSLDSFDKADFQLFSIPVVNGDNSTSDEDGAFSSAGFVRPRVSCEKRRRSVEDTMARMAAQGSTKLSFFLHDRQPLLPVTSEEEPASPKLRRISCDEDEVSSTLASSAFPKIVSDESLLQSPNKNQRLDYFSKRCTSSAVCA